MLDRKRIRADPEHMKKMLKSRNMDLKLIEMIYEKDSVWKRIKAEADELRAERNKLGLAIAANKKAGKPADKELGRSADISARIKAIDEEMKRLEDDMEKLEMQIPNIPHATVPVGKDENDNPELRKTGKPEKTGADVMDHHKLGEFTGWIDFERGVKLAEHRFSVVKGPLAKLERALINFMLNVQTSAGYLEVIPPYMVNTKTMTGTGQLPKFAEDLYRCKDDDLWLIPTAEVPLTNMFAGEVLEEKDLPVKLTAYTPCFRREAGAYGKDIKGLIRQHQFDKVELVKFAHPENSYEELEALTKDAENILKLLELPYRTILLCTGDMGFASAKTYDIEVWLPSQDRYREISSCSNCEDFQARRANIRFRGKDGKHEFVHTLNGSGLAVGRTMLAIVENFQEDKGLKIPKALQGYMQTDYLPF
ncbi:MAG: serine--tRNA ligase [Candidatus Bilamarchaeaceae archaeon]